MSTAVQNTTPPSGFSEFWFYFSRNKGAVIGLAVFLVILVLAVFTAVLIYIRHHENIARLLKGAEPKIGAKKA